MRGVWSRYREPKKTVTINQLKLLKNEEWLLGGFNLSPSDESVKAGGKNPCLWSGMCAKHCLNKSGMNQMSTHEIARINKLLLWQKEPDVFMSKSGKEISAMLRKADREGKKSAFRPNLLSDDYDLFLGVEERFPHLQQYDYTKYPKPWERVSDNYHLTYSLDVGKGREITALRCLERGINVAVPFDIPLDAPMISEWTLFGKTYPVIDGDVDDLRFLDPKGVFVGLRGKRISGGMQAPRDTGFYRSVA